MEIYLPIAQMSVNPLIVLAMGGVSACCPACWASAADF